jgi:hypothetical protein
MRQAFLGQQVQGQGHAHRIGQAARGFAHPLQFLHVLLGLLRIGRGQVIGEPQLAALQMGGGLLPDERLQRDQDFDLVGSAKADFRCCAAHVGRSWKYRCGLLPPR